MWICHMHEKLGERQTAEGRGYLTEYVFVRCVIPKTARSVDNLVRQSDGYQPPVRREEIKAMKFRSF